ncbi:MAG: hypothetical protein CMJ72_08460 [Planctomycetaceae bacterium]|nr:hypothetical protein [Planctomycetaceae bacterium]HCK41147.1 hypothetical protein [Planctomycetaceae bacterium]|tara:strand:+ start:311 stop:901 length:591 start_codon:yes stop_codon:yes gene_type:complete
MTRIFPTLAATSLGLFLLSIVLGLCIGDLYQDLDSTSSAFRLRGIHMLTGTATALAVVLVHSIAVTYFIGTSRWCREVTETYQLAPNSLQRSNQLKRKTFPWCVLGMLTVVVVGAMGAASDPGTGRSDTASWAGIHQMSAFAGLALIAWTYYRAWLNIVSNQVVIQQIVDDVAKIRQERGLDDPESAAESPVVNSQ